MNFTNIIIATLACLILVAAFYVGTYASLVQADPQGAHYYADPDQIAARYRACDGVCQTVFAPAEAVDRRMRPDYWRFACVW